jgi:hypothetical protein
MPPQPIPDEHHVSRHVKNKLIYPTLNGERRVDSLAFRLRPDEIYVSVDWVEYFQGDLRQQLDTIRNVLINLRRFNIKKNSALAVVNVYEIKAAGQKGGCELSVLNLGNQYDPSHSGIYGLPQNPDDEFILEEIAIHARVEDAWSNPPT